MQAINSPEVVDERSAIWCAAVETRASVTYLYIEQRALSAGRESLQHVLTVRREIFVEPREPHAQISDAVRWGLSSGSCQHRASRRPPVCSMVVSLKSKTSDQEFTFYVYYVAAPK
jgi:hypothetical protein